MPTRRRFLQSSLIAGISCSPLGRLLAGDAQSAPYTLTRDVPTKLYDGTSCYCHPRVGMARGAGENGTPRAVMTLNTVDMEGSDVFRHTLGLHSNDLKIWTEPREIPTLTARVESIEGQQRPIAVSDFWPRWHAASRTLLGTGHTVVYTPEWRVEKVRPRHAAWSIYNADDDAWSAWQALEMPDPVRFHQIGAGCTQRVDLADGNILLPLYFSPPEGNSRVIIARCSFDGRVLRHLEHGEELHIDDKTRGFHEPSLARYNDMYYLTLRNDAQGFVTRSRDGLNFEPYRPWTFDDGSELGNYNTQQHWVVHSDALYLVYTRRGLNNDHVMRHRAPLLMAQVDPERLCVLRATEQILVPERGARLGNFGVTDVSPDETWVTVAEWMQPRGVERHGSDGSVYVARVRWKRPNGLMRDEG